MILTNLRLFYDIDCFPYNFSNLKIDVCRLIV